MLNRGQPSIHVRIPIQFASWTSWRKNEGRPRERERERETMPFICHYRPPGNARLINENSYAVLVNRRNQLTTSTNLKKLEATINFAENSMAQNIEIKKKMLVSKLIELQPPKILRFTRVWISSRALRHRSQARSKIGITTGWRLD